ncbi:hypothetical protein ACFQV2_14825 [Actinokineospora soli]|uniref:Uncharacterized protein n=1 Tax=Actinokineospora soli TaxID=1048753 RepID=A0ABW2TM92_9PSEU
MGARVVAPLVAGGLIVRRPRVLGLLTRAGADEALVAELRRLRARHGDGPVGLRVAGRTVVVPLNAQDAAEVLAETPVPYSPPTGRRSGRCATSSRTAC